MKKIIRAEWVLPIRHRPIKDGAVLIDKGRILKVGPASKIVKQFRVPVHDLGSVILLPGLVNAHTHLEYSCLKDKIKPKRNFKDWLIEIVELKKNIKKDEVLKSVKAGIKNLQRSGTILLGEITNTGLTATELQKSGLSGVIFYELVGNSLFEDYLKIEKKLIQEAPSFEISVSCHATHSVPHALMSEVGQYLRKTGKRSSIHLAESSAEVQWMRSKEGPLSKLIHKESLIQNPDLGKNLGPVEYLKKKKLLNSKTLCVHCIHLGPQEMAELKKLSCFIAICPRSNQYTGAGRARVKKLLDLKIPLCLGTDSLASNQDLNLWNEMKALKNAFPFLPHPFILRMATLNGAQALGFGQIYGSIEPGKKPCFIYVKTSAKKITDPYKFLIEEDHDEVYPVRNP